MYGKGILEHATGKMDGVAKTAMQCCSSVNTTIALIAAHLAPILAGHTTKPSRSLSHAWLSSRFHVVLYLCL